MAMAEKTVLLYPCPELGHLNPMVQLAEALVRRGVSVTLAVADPPDKGAVLAGAIARIAAACPSIGVRLLPIPSCEDKTYSHPVMWIVDAARLANPALRELLRSLSAVDALVVDMFCIDALDIAAELAVPAYMFYPSAASDLAVYLQVPHVARSAPSSFKDMGDTVLSFSGVPTIRALDMPDTMQDRESDVGTTRIHHCSRMAETRGKLGDHRSKLGEVDLEAFLPEGFLERTKGRGFVVKNWAPQSAVLQHGAVGAFVTHCGWNSSLEAIMSGVPIMCWPLYAEQRLNKAHLVEEMKVGVVVEGYDGELVKADELETKVRLVMESEEGKKLRERSAMAKEMAAGAVKDGGSSDMAFAEFLNNLGTNNVKSGLRDTPPVHD